MGYASPGLHRLFYVFHCCQFPRIASVGGHHQRAAGAVVVVTVEPIGGPAVVGQKQASLGIDGEAVVENAVFGEGGDYSTFGEDQGSPGRFRI